METIAQQLGITEYPYREFDGCGRLIYLENVKNSIRGWSKWEYDERGNRTYWENSGGHWRKSEYGENGKEVKWQTSSGLSGEHKYDENGNEIYFKNSTGYIRYKDNNGN